MWAQEKRLEGCGAERTPEMHSLRMQGPGYGRDATTPKGRPSLPEEGRHPSQQPLAGDGFGRAASGAALSPESQIDVGKVGLRLHMVRRSGNQTIGGRKWKARGWDRAFLVERR